MVLKGLKTVLSLVEYFLVNSKINFEKTECALSVLLLKNIL
jgi:hypothetical protein